MVPSTKQNAIRKVKEIQAFRPLFLDTETTGLAMESEIVEFALIDYEGTTLFNSLVKPKRPIPADATIIHHITNEMVADSPSWPDIWPEIESLLRNKYIGTYNADFDLRMIRQTHLLNGMNWVEFPGRSFCVMKLYADFFPYTKGKYQRLEDAGKQCGIKIPNSHRALDDSQLAREIFSFMARSN